MHGASILSALLALAAPAVAFNPFTMQCYSGAYILSARGTDQSYANSSLAPIGNAIVDRIPDSFYTEIVYPANFEFIKSGLIGITNVTEQLVSYAIKCPNSKTVLLGYSQGSAVVDIVLSGANLGILNNTDLSTFIPQGTNLTGIDLPPITSIAGDNVAAVVMYGDGTFVRGQGTQPDCNACMSNGTLPLRQGSNFQDMEQYADRLLDFCDASDPICCTTGTDPKAHVSYFNNASIDYAVDFVVQKFAEFNATGPSSTTSSAPSSTSSACVTIFPTSSASGTSGGVSATGSSSSSPTKTGGASTTAGSVVFMALAAGAASLVLL